MTRTDAVPGGARVAVLVDGDAFPLKLLKDVNTIARGLGDVAEKIIFVRDSAATSAWRAATASHGFRAIPCRAPVSGKSTVDIRMALDAYRLARDGAATSFLLVTNDSDFMPLSETLAGLGCHVSGAAFNPVHADLRRSYHAFYPLNVGEDERGERNERRPSLKELHLVRASLVSGATLRERLLGSIRAAAELYRSSGIPQATLVDFGEIVRLVLEPGELRMKQVLQGAGFRALSEALVVAGLSPFVGPDRKSCVRFDEAGHAAGERDEHLAARGGEPAWAGLDCEIPARQRLRMATGAVLAAYRDDGVIAVDMDSFARGVAAVAGVPQGEFFCGTGLNSLTELALRGGHTLMIQAGTGLVHVGLGSPPAGFVGRDELVGAVRTVLAEHRDSGVAWLRVHAFSSAVCDMLGLPFSLGHALTLIGGGKLGKLVDGLGFPLGTEPCSGAPAIRLCDREPAVAALPVPTEDPEWSHLAAQLPEAATPRKRTRRAILLALAAWHSNRIPWVSLERLADAVNRLLGTDLRDDSVAWRAGFGNFAGAVRSTGLMLSAHPRSGAMGVTTDVGELDDAI